MSAFNSAPLTGWEDDTTNVATIIDDLQFGPAYGVRR